MAFGVAIDHGSTGKMNAVNVSLQPTSQSLTNTYLVKVLLAPAWLKTVLSQAVKDRRCRFVIEVTARLLWRELCLKGCREGPSLIAGN